MREGKSGPYEGDCGVLLQVQPGGLELEMGGGGAGQVQAGGTDIGGSLVEPALGGDLNGSPDWVDYAKLCETVDSRTDELRLLGNGVDPDVAAKAFVTLYGRLVGER